MSLNDTAGQEIGDAAWERLAFSWPNTSEHGKRIVAAYLAAHRIDPTIDAVRDAADRLDVHLF